MLYRVRKWGYQGNVKVQGVLEEEMLCLQQHSWAQQHYAPIGFHH